MPKPRKYKPLREGPPITIVRQPLGDTFAYLFESFDLRTIASLRVSVRARDHRPYFLHGLRFELIHFGSDAATFEGQVIVWWRGEPALLCTFGTEASGMLWQNAVVPFLDNPDNVPDMLWATYRQISGRSPYWTRQQAMGWVDIERHLIAYVYAALDEYHSPKRDYQKTRRHEKEIKRLGEMWDDMSEDMSPIHARYDVHYSEWDEDAKRAYWRWAEMRMVSKRGYAPESYRRIYKAWRRMRDREIGIADDLPDAEKKRLRMAHKNAIGGAAYRERQRPFIEARKAERAQAREDRLKAAGIDLSLSIAEQNRLFAIHATKAWRENKKAAGEWDQVRARHREGERRYEAVNRAKIIAEKAKRRKERLQSDPAFKERVKCWKAESYQRSKARKLSQASGTEGQPDLSQPPEGA